MFVILSMVVSLTYVTVMEQKMSQKTKSSVGAFYGAESGIEWALNQIATTNNPDTTSIQTKFSLAANGSKACPFGDCSVYFLDEDSKVILSTSGLYVSDIKAVRSVGSGGETQRSIEAAVADTGTDRYQISCTIYQSQNWLVCFEVDTQERTVKVKYNSNVADIWRDYTYKADFKN
jgi:hypothetical protein